jgi:hypothetical protein
MPLRHERNAPRFDASKPRELPRFFQDLEDLFDRVTQEPDEPEKKNYVLRYVDFSTEQIWKTFAEYDSPLATYINFKEAILKHYPDACGDFVYSLRDMDMLIGERQRLGINSNRELADYHLQFLTITSWLIKKEHLGHLEQQRAYIRVFQPDLLNSIMNRLQLTDHEHHPSIPYTVEKVYNAARFILQGTTSVGFYTPTPPRTLATLPTPPAMVALSPDVYMKTENLGPILAEFSKNIIEAFNQSNRTRQHNHGGNGSTLKCNMCGGVHFIKDCKIVDEYISQGKVKRNHDGKVVLPSGAFVSRDISGEFLKDRIDEWHRRNPNQRAASTLIHTIVEDQTYPTADNPFNPTSIYQLSKTERIATLEAELFHLRTKKVLPTSTIQTRAQKAKAPVVANDDREDIATTRTQNQARIEEVDDEDDQQVHPKASKVTPPVTITNTQPSTVQPTTLPEHPYRHAKDAAYTPPTNRNVGAQDKGTPAVPKKTEPAYRTLPPIHDPAIAATVYKRSMDTQVTLTQRELLSLSPEVRSQVRDSTTTRRIANKDQPITRNLFQIEEEDQMDYNPDTPRYPASTFAFATSDYHHHTTAKGSVVVSDPVEAYYRSLNPEEEPDLERLIVAMDSAAVRAVSALIDNNQKTECILDPGCQIISMSNNICHELGLAYDPTIKLQMQSANGALNYSLGLSRNVPFQIGTITFYFQVHIIDSPAYDVLLGRPFDILTESIVQNFANEDQTITIHDPNTSRRVTIPTLPRSKTTQRKQSTNRRMQDFQD